MICPNCGTQLKEGALFCTECGTKLSEQNAAPQVMPPQPAQPEIGAAPQEASEWQAAAPEQKAPQGVKPMIKPVASKKPVKKGSILIAVIAILGTIVGIVIALMSISEAKPSKGKEYALYIKDEEIWYTDFSKTGAWQITDQLFAGDLGRKQVSGQAIQSRCFVSEDGSMIYYPDHIEDDFNSFTLYARSLSKREKEPVRVAKDVITYIAAADNSSVLYSDADGGLYLFSFKKEEKQKIAKDLDATVNGYDFAATADLKTIVFREEGTVYLLDKNGEKLKLASDVARFFLSRDGSFIIYLQANPNSGYSIYKKSIAGDKTKICDDARPLIAGTLFTADLFYYITTEKIDMPASQLFEDDVPSDKSYDDFRDYLKDKKVSIVKEKLFCFDGTNTTQLLESYRMPMEMMSLFPTLLVNGTEDPFLMSVYYDEPKDLIKFSSEKDMSALIAALGRFGRYPKKAYVVGTLVIDSEANRLMEIPYRAENAVYLLKVPEDYDGDLDEFDEEGELFERNLETGEETLVFAGVEDYSWWIEDGKVYHLKDEKLKRTGPLYLNDQWIADDVDSTTDTKIQEFGSVDGFVLFITDVVVNSENSNWNIYSLWAYDGKKPIHIADEVQTTVGIGSKGVLYLTEFSSKREQGDMYRYYNGKSELIDEEVSYIFRTR